MSIGFIQFPTLNDEFTMNAKWTLDIQNWRFVIFNIRYNTGYSFKINFQIISFTHHPRH